MLDLFSSRLDAWLTALAHCRLTRQREARPTGIHLGCYGWVEDLRPDSGAGAESLGHVLAPSLGHAVAAAVLRSGRQAHAGSGAFDLDLSSVRVREAMALLEGVAAGQSIAALVGYRVERRLRDAGLADLTVPLRIEAPLQARDDEHEEPVESVAARDVVDGVKLLSLFAGPPNEWEALVGRVGAEARRRPVGGRAAGRGGELRRRHRRAVRRMRSSADGRQPRTGERRGRGPRSPGATGRGRRRAHAAGGGDGDEPGARFAAGDSPAAGWPARGVRGRAEPRLDSWLGNVLGDPAALTASGRLVRPAAVDGEPDVVTDLGTVSAAELGLSPLALVLTAERPAPGGVVRVGGADRRRARRTGRRSSARRSDRVRRPQRAAHGDRLGWAPGSWAAAGRWREPTWRSPRSAGNVVAGTVDLDELRARVDGCVDAVRAARTT